jgi:type II secretion system (T2SS) protein M
MKLQEREKKFLIFWVVAMTLGLGWWVLSKDDGPAPVVQAVDNIPSAEKRLTRLRQLSASVPGEEEALQRASAELAAREKGLIQADTAAQAQAQLLQIMRKLGKAQSSPIDMRNSEIGQVKPYGEKYGEVAVSLNFEAHIEQLVQLLSDLTAQKEIIGVSDLRVGSATPKEKMVPIRLTVSALVRRELVPDKKGSASL